MRTSTQYLIRKFVGTYLVDIPGKKDRKPAVFVHDALIPVHGSELRALHLDAHKGLRAFARFVGWCWHLCCCLVHEASAINTHTTVGSSINMNELSLPPFCILV